MRREEILNFTSRQKESVQLTVQNTKTILFKKDSYVQHLFHHFCENNNDDTKKKLKKHS